MSCTCQDRYACTELYEALLGPVRIVNTTTYLMGHVVTNDSRRQIPNIPQKNQEVRLDGRIDRGGFPANKGLTSKSWGISGSCCYHAIKVPGFLNWSGNGRAEKLHLQLRAVLSRIGGKNTESSADLD